MLSFNEWNNAYYQNIEEMASNNNISYVGSRKSEFTNNFNTEFMKLVKSGINSEHYKLYRYGSGTFYLANDNDEYLGFIDGHLEGIKYYILLSSSEIKGNFYNLMFTSILGLTNIEEIISDESLSPQAIKAYNNLNTRSQLTLQVLSHNNYIPYSEENVLKNSSNRVVVTETVDFNITEAFVKSFTIPSIYKLYIHKEEIFNNRIYCESFVY